MIVFGDQSWTCEAGQLVQSLAARVREATARPTESDLVRSALIFSGQVEQALADACDDSEAGLEDAHAWVRICTDALAALLIGKSGALSDPSECPRGDWLHRSVKVKVPEGYAFYSLYPDQYAAAAWTWARENQAAFPGPVLVIGLRSIGTSLSAIVAAALDRKGWKTSRVTVRPAGGQDARHVWIEPDEVASVRRVLIVDEGPGQSGTSFAAAAQAISDQGVGRERIAFFPAHANPPGPAATPAARDWWSRTSKFTTTTDQPVLEGRKLRDHLRADSRDLLGESVDEGRCVSGGLWREWAFKEQQEWPGVFALLEREKYLFTGIGTGKRVLWKFAGLAAGEGSLTGCQRECVRLRALAAEGFTPRVLGSCLGYIATEWVEGSRLHRSDASPEVLRHVAEYLRAAPEDELSQSQAVEARERAAHILYWNTRKGLGEVVGDAASALCDQVRALPLMSTRQAPDGRLAPHEWIRTPDGRILKCDAGGHAHDHTAVGRQPMAWDVAGVAVEWGLNGGQAAAMLVECGGSGVADRLDVELRFYRAAYAAFKLGYCVFGSQCAGGDDEERERLERDRGYYERHLRAALGCRAAALA